MNLFSKSKQKKYENTMKILKEKSIDQLRDRIKILLVDDERYDIIEILRNRGYRIYYKEDITYTIETEPFDLILLDINGIADKFASTKQGFGFALEVKKIYPQKIVVSFSGVSDPKINEQLDKIDGYIAKDTDVDMWCIRLDNLIKRYCDPEYQWNAICSKLKDSGVSKEVIEELKTVYMESLDSNSFDNIKNAFIENVNDSKLIFDVLGSVIALVKVFGY